MPERLAYVDAFSGAGGDMLLGALADAGVPLEALSEDLRKLPGGDAIRLRLEPVTRGGLRAAKVHVEIEEHAGHAHHVHRGLHDIRHILETSQLPEDVRRRADTVFTRLGEAEARVHGVGIEAIHFHEVGALDAIADIVGAVCGLRRLGIERLYFSTLRLGGGTARMAHGVLPVPAPATAELVKGLRCEMGPVEAELLTPTGAALLTTLGIQGAPPAFRALAVGCGAGSGDFPGHPNVLRLLVGEIASADESDAVWVLEANLDDVTPEVCGHTLDRLLAAGALDAYVTPLLMKKSRPGFMLSALVGDDALARVEEVFFQETTTFGVRRHRVERARLGREFRTVETPYGPVRVKVGKRGDAVVTISPEYEDCRRIALERSVPLRDVMRAASEHTPTT